MLFLLYLLGFVFADQRIAYYDLGSPIDLITIDSDRLYISSTNRLSLLNITSLLELHRIETGPQLDSPLCNYDSSACINSAELSPTDYIAKILHITELGLLICGTLRQGTCQIRSPTDLNLLRSGSVAVAPNDAAASCVSIIDQRGTLFTAATYAKDSPYRESFPAVSSRTPPNYHIINSGSIEGEAAVYIRAEHRFRFRVNYVATFMHKQYIYFIGVQNKIPSNNAPGSNVVSKLIRICKDDDRYISYCEIEIQCRGTDNRNFDTVVAVSLVGESLIAAFTDHRHSQSVICIYPMQKVSLTFWYNIDRCRMGSDTVGLPHIGRDNKCKNKSHIPLSEDTCAMGVGGTIECDQISSHHSDYVITSLAAINTNNITVLICGTNDGTVIKYEVDDWQIMKYSQVAVSDHAIKNLHFIDEQMYLGVADAKTFLNLTLDRVSQYAIDYVIKNRTLNVSKINFFFRNTKEPYESQTWVFKPMSSSSKR